MLLRQADSEGQTAVWLHGCCHGDGAKVNSLIVTKRNDLNTAATNYYFHQR